jgi:hypothetical protein
VTPRKVAREARLQARPVSIRVNEWQTICRVIRLLNNMKTPQLQPEFQPGQVWSRDSQFSPHRMIVTIIAVEDAVVHVLVSGLEVRSPSGELLTRVFLPMAQSALAKSHLLPESADCAEFATLYGEWTSEHDTRGQGYFTVTLEELFEGLSHGQ